MVGMSVINTIMGSSGGGLMSLFLTHLQAQYIDQGRHQGFNLTQAKIQNFNRA